jgi:hypothetical protein
VNLTQAVMHTTGVNWESIGTLLACITAVFGVLARLITLAITRAIDRFRIEVVDKLDKRMIAIETDVEFLIAERRRRRRA